MRKLIAVITVTIIFFVFWGFQKAIKPQPEHLKYTADNGENFGEKNGVDLSYPLVIEYMRKQKYEGSEITIEETLQSGENYNRYVASYRSDGLKIYALLTIPMGEKPKNGWPVIIFNHGYIPPREYVTTQRYIAYTDVFSRNGYIVFKSDYRGHGNSEGQAVGGYGSSAYTIDILNALSSLKKFKDANPNKIGMWGHSMGGFITLRSMVISKDIKVSVIWGGVVASYKDLIYNWRRTTFTPSPLPSGTRRWRDLLIAEYGSPEKNPQFWNSISANAYLKDISGPLQLQHGQLDASVPIEFSEKLEKELKKIGKTVEFYSYPMDDHNLTNNFTTAIGRSVDFFDKYLK